VTADNKNEITVSYIGDLPHSAPDDVLLVESDEDYVRVCMELSRQAKPAPIRKVWVRSKSHFAWLQDFTEQIEYPANFEEKTARLVLADQWNVQIPDWLDDEIVVEQRLLDLQVDVEQAARFEERILAHFLGPVFYADQLESTNLVEVVLALNRPEITNNFSKYAVLKRCLVEKIKIWERLSSKKWVRKICTELILDPEKLWKDITLWCLLARYPRKLLEYVLTPDRLLWLQEIPLEAFKDFLLHRGSVEQALTQVEMFFKEIGSSIKTRDDFHKILKCTSGRLLKEFQLITELLSSGSFDASKQDITEVQEKFRSCPGVSSGKLAALERFVKPKKPSLPEKEALWETEQWIHWGVEEYIPYRHWQTLSHHFDSEVETAVGLFSDWYLGAYVTIHKDGERSLVYLLNHWENRLKEDALSLILLVDSLPLTFWGLFQDTLSKAGFYRHELTYRFTPLPSHTDTVKPLMLSGSWEGQEKSYEDILTKRSERDWNGKKIIYLSNLKALSDLEPPKQPSIVLLNLLDIDDLLHSDVELRDTTYEEELYRFFARLADSAKRLFDGWQGASEDFSLHVITDHGASRILEEEKASLDSKVVNKLFPDEKHRFSRINKAEADKIPQNWSLGYRFSQPFISEDVVYFIPRGHNTVKRPKKEKGYVHGGATPEEVIVPAAIFRPVKPTWKALFARLLNLKIDRETGKAVFYIQRVIPLEIEVQNPNPEPVQILQVDVLSPDTEVKACTRPNIEAGKYGTIQIDCYFNKSALGSEELVVQLTYEIAGEKSTRDLTQAAEFKSALTGGFSLKDLK